MSNMIRSVINSAIDDDRILNVLYYPELIEPQPIDYEILNLNYNFYLPAEIKGLTSLPNVYYRNNFIHNFPSINLDSIIASNNLTNIDNILSVSNQLHIQSLFVFSKEPQRIKKEHLFVQMEKIQKTSTCISLSREIAKTWFLSDYELINNIKELEQVIKECRMLYLKK